MSTYVGQKVEGIAGASVATLSFIIPALISMYIIHKVFNKFKDNERVKRALELIRSSAFATILISCFDIFKNTFIYKTNLINFKAIALFLVVYMCMKKKKIHPLIYMMISGIIGVVFKL